MTRFYVWNEEKKVGNKVFKLSDRKVYSMYKKVHESHNFSLVFIFNYLIKHHFSPMQVKQSFTLNVQK